MAESSWYQHLVSPRDTSVMQQLRRPSSTSSLLLERTSVVGGHTTHVEHTHTHTHHRLRLMLSSSCDSSCEFERHNRHAIILWIRETQSSCYQHLLKLQDDDSMTNHWRWVYRTHKMLIAWRWVYRTHKMLAWRLCLSNSQDDSVIKAWMENRTYSVKGRACESWYAGEWVYIPRWW
jgi:hypothetical protein